MQLLRDVTCPVFVLRSVQILLFNAPCVQPYTSLSAVCLFYTVLVQPDFGLISTLQTEKSCWGFRCRVQWIFWDFLSPNFFAAGPHR